MVSPIQLNPVAMATFPASPTSAAPRLSPKLPPPIAVEMLLEITARPVTRAAMSVKLVLVRMFADFVPSAAPANQLVSA
ncbi:hypothetical protein D3C84_857660 [compost metagenome]